MLSGACGRGGAGVSRLVDQRGEALDFAADQRRPVRARRRCRASASTRRASSCAAPFRPASGLRSSCARPLSAADKRRRQQQRRIVAGKFVDRMRLQQPAAVVARDSARRRRSTPRRRRSAAGCGAGAAARRRRRPGARIASARRLSPPSSPASGQPVRRRALTPSQREKAALQPAIAPSSSLHASGVVRASRSGRRASGNGAADIAPY